MDETRRAELTARYRRATHAMQAGVAAEMGLPGCQAATEPKHLRVGVNAALADAGGLVQLLVAKGVITDEEYLEAIAEAMEAEVQRYEERLSATTGSRITLRGAPDGL